MESERSKESRVVRVNLYESNLEETKGMLYARLAHEKPLAVRDVCAIVRERGGFQGDPRVMEDHVNRFFDEAGRQVCNGRTVNMAGWISARAQVTGIFKQPQEGVSPEKHPVEIRCQPGVKFQEAAEFIEVYVEGMAQSKAFIGEFLDVKSKLVNRKATVGGLFMLAGNLIKIFGPDAQNGLRFTSPGIPAVVAPMENLAVNEPHKIVGIVPELLPGRLWTVEIQTQYCKSSTPLKEPKVITSDFTLSV